MKHKIKIKLLEEEMDTLQEGKGKEVEVYENENVEVIISYKIGDSDLDDLGN